MEKITTCHPRETVCFSFESEMHATTRKSLYISNNIYFSDAIATLGALAALNFPNFKTTESKFLYVPTTFKTHFLRVMVLQRYLNVCTLSTHLNLIFCFFNV